MAGASDILTEIDAVAAFIGDIFKGSDVYKQRVPESPATGDISVGFEKASSEQETAATYVDIRDWRIVIFGEKEFDKRADPDLLAKMDEIKRATVGALRQVIPLDSRVLGMAETVPDDRSLRYMRIAVNGFSYGAPVKTKDDRWACVGMLRTEVRQARDLQAYEKIMKAGIRTVVHK